MKAKFKLIAAVLAISALIGIPGMMSVSASDGCILNEDDPGTLYDSWCDTEDGCGFLGLKDTWYEKYQYNCRNTSSSHRLYCDGYLYHTEKNGCC